MRALYAEGVGGKKSEMPGKRPRYDDIVTGEDELVLLTSGEPVGIEVCLIPFTSVLSSELG